MNLQLDVANGNNIRKENGTVVRVKYESQDFQTNSIEGSSPAWNCQFVLNDVKPRTSIQFLICKESMDKYSLTGELSIDKVTSQNSEFSITLSENGQIKKRNPQSLLVRACLIKIDNSNIPGVYYPSNMNSQVVKYPTIVPLQMSTKGTITQSNPKSSLPESQNPPLMPSPPVFSILEDRIDEMYRYSIGTKDSLLTPRTPLRWNCFQPGTFLHVQNDGTIGIGPEPSGIEIHYFDDTIGLYAVQNNLYFSVKSKDSILCDAKTVGLNETFTLYRSKSAPDDISLKSSRTNLFVVCWKDGHISADGPGNVPTLWSRFNTSKF